MVEYLWTTFDLHKYWEIIFSRKSWIWFSDILRYATSHKIHPFVKTDAPEIKREAAIKQEVIEINDEVCTCRIWY